MKCLQGSVLNSFAEVMCNGALETVVVFNPDPFHDSVILMI